MEKLKPFNTDTVDVVWAHLHRPDDKFGAPGNHNITIALDDQLNDQLNKIAAEAGAKKINGLNEKEGKTTIKVKSTLFTNPPEGQEKLNAFPCVDSSTNATNEVAMGGDKVRLRLKPFLLTRDNSMSFFLNGVQIIEKSSNSSSGSGFEATDGYVAPADEYVPPVATEDNDTPF